MSLSDDLDDLLSDESETIISEPIRFKEKLGIGEKAYGLLRMREHLSTFTEALGVGATVSTATSSSVVAGAFFTQGGMFASALSAIGLAPVAVTPIGWVVAAGLASGAAYIGVSRFFERSKDSHLIIIPKHINTPLDVIALALIELMLPISLKIADSDGSICSREGKTIRDFYHGQWGYSEAFLERVIPEYEQSLCAISIAKLTKSLEEFCENNPDCEPESIREGFINHVTELIEADGIIHEHEERFLRHLKELLGNTTEGSVLSRSIKSTGRTAASGLEKSRELASNTANAVREGATSGFKTTTNATAKASRKAKSLLHRTNAREDESQS